MRDIEPRMSWSVLFDKKGRPSLESRHLYGREVAFHKDVSYEETIRCRDDYHCGKALLHFEAMLKLESFSQYEYKNPQINPIENNKYKVSQINGKRQTATFHFLSCSH